MALTLTIRCWLPDRVARTPDRSVHLVLTGLLAGVGIVIRRVGWLVELWGLTAAFVAGAIVAVSAGMLAAVLLQATQRPCGPGAQSRRSTRR